MKFIKKFLLGMAAILAILAIISMFLPQNVSVRRAITIRAEADAVFAYVNNLGKFHEWSPWALHDPAMVPVFTGPEEGVGARMSWSSEAPGVGTGSQEIIESRTNEYVKVALEFGDQGNGEADYSLNYGEGRTRITWGFQKDLGYNPIARYMGLMFDDWIGGDYEIGLVRLKTLVESVNPSEE